jgi:hypothetical protein
VLVVNDEPKARWRVKGYWFRLMLPTAWPNTSGEVSILRSPAMEKRVGPLRGVGEPSEVMLKLMVAGRGSVSRLVEIRGADVSRIYNGTLIYRKQLESNLELLGKCADNMQNRSSVKLGWRQYMT